MRRLTGSSLGKASWGGGGPGGARRHRRRAGGGPDQPVSARSRLAVRGRGEWGGAVSLWVVLMVPVSAFAAVVAMAGPQRLAAESSMREAADDVATMAVAWRYTHQQETGPIPAFPPECSHDGSAQQERQDELEDDRPALEAARNAVDRGVNPDEWTRLDDDVKAQQRKIDAYGAKLGVWRGACEALFESVVRDLGNLGVDVGSLRGFYSDSLDVQSGVPCKISERVVVRDAVHVALAADWQDAGWAAAQVWPEGRRLGAESIGRRSRAVVSATDITAVCGDSLDVLDGEGRPVVLTKRDAPSRKLVEGSAKRTPLSG